jgi:hypothetical protein
MKDIAHWNGRLPAFLGPIVLPGIRHSQLLIKVLTVAYTHQAVTLFWRR